MALKIETLGPESCCFFFFPAKRIWGKNRYLTKKWHEFNYSLFWGYNIVCSPINQERKLSRKLRIPCREHRMQLKNLNNSNRDGQPPAQRGIWSSLVIWLPTSTLFITSPTFPEQRTPVLGPPSLKSKQPFPMGDPECTLEQSQMVRRGVGWEPKGLGCLLREYCVR